MYACLPLGDSVFNYDFCCLSDRFIGSDKGGADLSYNKWAHMGIPMLISTGQSTWCFASLSFPCSRDVLTP